MLDLVQALVEGEQASHEEQDDRHDKAVDEPTSSVAEIVMRVSALLRPLVSDQQEHLIARVSNRVDCLREERGRTGERKSDELAHCDSQVGEQCRHYRP